MSGRLPKIRARGLKKSFGSKTVLSGVDFDVAAGESLVIIGGSGTGKSVALKCVLGLIRPDGGEVAIDGRDTVGLAGGERARLMAKFGVLFQGGALFDSLAVWENVAFRLLRQLPRRRARERALEALAMVGLGGDVAGLHPAELSGGMMKRVALARAVAVRPEIVFFDEPTTGLDPIMADVINDLIVSVSRSLGAATVSITHDMASARKIAHRIAMLHGGRLIWDGPAGAIDDSGNAHVEQFVHGRAEGPIVMDVLRP